MEIEIIALVLYLIKSDFIYIAQNHNHIVSVGFTICTVNGILCPYTLYSSEEKVAMLIEKKTLLAG